MRKKKLLITSYLLLHNILTLRISENDIWIEFTIDLINLDSNYDLAH